MKHALAGSMFVLCLGVAWAQTSTSPQGGAAIYTGAAVCASSSFGFSGSQPLQPCVSPDNNGKWFTVMNASLKTSNTTDLFISPSLVTGLYTNTKVTGQSGNNAPDSETAAASGSVAVRVLLDCGNCAVPGQAQSGVAAFGAAAQPDPNGAGIIYDSRIQQLTATLGQAITSQCLTLVSGVLTNTCPPESIDLILSTTSAHTFNSILTNVGAGEHTITIQARLNTGQVCTSTNSNGGGGVTCSNTVNTSLGQSVAAALFGLGSVLVNPVHLGPGFTFN